MKTIRSAVCVAVVSLLFSLPGYASGSTLGLSLQVPLSPHELVLDATLADPVWQQGRVHGESGTWENVTTNAPASQNTTAYVLYDDHYLYVAFAAIQRDRITATQTTNDVGFGIDDFVGVGIDTSGVGSEAYYFETTPRGVRYEQSSENVRFRPRWRSAARITATGWQAVLIIPLSALRISKEGAQIWRIQFIRSIAARAEHYVWAYDPLMRDAPSGYWPTFADTRWWAEMTGLQVKNVPSVATRARADVYALESFGANRDLFEQADGEILPQKVRSVGIDVSYPITSTISFVGTANPDFSNVEVDQETIAPQEFARQLFEYRPFFSQGENFINSNDTQQLGAYSAASDVVFYSPTIGPFDYGAKVEGSFGDQSFGALTFRGFDQTTGNTFADTAFGYKHAVHDRTFLYYVDGVLAHHSNAGEDSTVEIGAIGKRLKNGFAWGLDHAFETGTWLPQGSANATSAYADIHRSNYEVNVGYLDISPTYNPIDGYTAIADIRGPQAYIAFNGTAPGIKNWSIFAEGDRFMDHSGAIHQADSQISLNATFANGFSFNGIGASVGQLRSYKIPFGAACSNPTLIVSYFTGYPCYQAGATSKFNLASIPIGYRDGTPSPIDVSYSWGPFGEGFLHQFSVKTARPIGQRMIFGIEYDGTYDRAISTGLLESQWLRRVSLSINLSSESTLTLALRSINGHGGFATNTGSNVAVAFHTRFHSGDELFINYGTPAATSTLNRLIIKYVFHAGADAGT